jgi:hypothetical protein
MVDMQQSTNVSMRSRVKWSVDPSRVIRERVGNMMSKGSCSSRKSKSPPKVRTVDPSKVEASWS